MATLIREYDWSKTPVGPIDTWPQSLVTALSICLGSRYPMFVWWKVDGELTIFYNDGYKAIAGAKHPRQLGANVLSSDGWIEIWPDLEPLVNQVFQEGRATYNEDLPLFMHRNGYPEEVYFTFSYSPINDESGAVAGMFCACHETTQQVLNNRRLKVLKDLGAGAALPSASAVVDQAMHDLSFNRLDIPFALFYECDSGGQKFLLRGATGLEAGTVLAPTAIEHKNESIASAWLQTDGAAEDRGKARVISLSPEAAFPTEPWGEPPHQAYLVPVDAPGHDRPAGVLVFGLSPRRAFDGDYESFLNMVARHMATNLANARAREAERRRAEELAELDRAKTAFFSNVSHEFRTPLTLMLGPLVDSLADLDEPLTGRQRDRQDLIYRNTQRLLKLVNHLLDFSRIEAGRVKAIYQPTDVSKQTLDLASLFQDAIEKSGLCFRMAIEPVDEPVFVDREMWEQIVLNLLSNALKFTLRGQISIALRKTGRKLQLAVSDTGTGIPEDEIPKLFQRFHRIQGAEGRTNEGTGIGLALIQELARLHGGNVAVQTTFGEGTTFTVTIPLGSEHLPQEQVGHGTDTTVSGIRGTTFVEEALRWLPDATVRPRITPENDSRAELQGFVAAGGKVLLADDNADMRAYICELLSPYFEVTQVANGRAAYQAALEGDFDLVLSDIMMPGIDGVELVKRLRATAVTQTLPIVLISARAGGESQVEGMKTGADDYLVKPFTAKELIVRVNTHVQLGKLRNAAVIERRRLNAILQSVPLIVWGADPQGRAVYFNEKWPVRTGMPIEESLGDGWLQAVHPADVTRISTQWKESCERQVEYVSEARIRMADGTYRWYMVRAVPLHTHEGETIEWVGTGIDIDDPKRAQLAYERNIDAGPALLWITERDGSCSYLSNQWYQYTGQTPETGLGVGWLNATHPEDRERSGKAFAEANAIQQPFLAEYRLRDRNGNYRWAMDAGNPRYDSEGNFAGFAGAVFDIHEQKLAREELERNEESLRLAVRARDEFLSIASHELKTPLTSLSMQLQMAERRLESLPEFGNKSERLARSLSVSLRQISRLTALVDDLLDISRIQSGRLSFTFETVDISGLVREVVERFADQLDSSAPPVRYHSNGPRSVYCDPFRVEQVVLNLLSNAFKYGDGSQVTVTVRQLENGAVQIDVADQGMGIPAEKQKAIFERFERAVSHHQISGLGLGLYICNQIIEGHGGKVTVASEPGRGATFSVILPPLPKAA